MKPHTVTAVLLSALTMSCAQEKILDSVSAERYKIVDTGQKKCFDNQEAVAPPAVGDAFYGQDAQHAGNEPSYADNGDGTVTDQVTGLVWQKDYLVLSQREAAEKAKSLTLGGHSDWRIPSIRELYSLMQFSGVDVSGGEMPGAPPNLKGVAFINTDYFAFKYGSNGPRAVDVQLLSSTLYQGTTMNGNATVFGLNIADGRIKGYPLREPWGEDKKFTVRFVRGNPGYGTNRFQASGNGTVTDSSTGLMWEQADSKKALTWEEALAWAVQKNKEKHLGYNNWRVPNAKELHSILDYSRSPQQTSSAAINELFEVSAITDEGGKRNYPFYWTSTTHENALGGGRWAVYLCFGEALGFFAPPGSADKTLMDVHGAGAQRSDPKTGEAASFPEGNGPQGDVVRIKNHVRLVR